MGLSTSRSDDARCAGFLNQVGGCTVRQGTLGLLAVLIIGSDSSFDRAQAPLIADMPAVARALGVECGYCHPNRRNPSDPPALPSSGKPKLDIAKEMFAMTDQLNATVQAATGKV